MKKILILMLLSLFLCCCVKRKVREKSINRHSVLEYVGSYSFGDDVEKGGIGSILLYPDTDSTLLFYIDVCRGAPTYNMGCLFGRVKIINGIGVFYKKYDFYDNGCRLEFRFSKNILSIKTMDNQCECGFGYAVFADGEYRKKSDSIPEYFEDIDSHKIFFKDTKPEIYNSDD